MPTQSFPPLAEFVRMSKKKKDPQILSKLVKLNLKKICMGCLKYLHYQKLKILKNDKIAAVKNYKKIE